MRLASAFGTAGGDGCSTNPPAPTSTRASGYTAKVSRNASVRVGFTFRTNWNPAPNWACSATQLTGIGLVRECSR
jgi:hypothetical protein